MTQPSPGGIERRVGEICSWLLAFIRFCIHLCFFVRTLCGLDFILNSCASFWSSS